MTIIMEVEAACSSAILKLLLLAAALAYLARTFLRPPRSRKSTTSTTPLPPGPTPWPIVGNLPEMLLSKQPAFRWIHHMMSEVGTDIACVRLGGVHVVVITSPAIAREVLRTPPSPPGR